MTSDDLLIDKRTVRRNIEKGRLDKAAYRKLLEELPDLSNKVYRAEPASAPAAPAASAAAESPRMEAPAEDRAAASPAVPPYQPLSPG